MNAKLGPTEAIAGEALIEDSTIKALKFLLVSSALATTIGVGVTRPPAVDVKDVNHDSLNDKIVMDSAGGIERFMLQTKDGKYETAVRRKFEGKDYFYSPHGIYTYDGQFLQPVANLHKQ